MSGRDLDRNLERLLSGPRVPVEASREFREALRGRLHHEAARMRGRPEGSAEPREVAPGRRPAPWVVAAAAMVVVSVGGLGLTALLDAASRAQGSNAANVPRASVAHRPGASGAHRVSLDRAAIVEIPRGACGAVDLDWRGSPVALLDLTDGARVQFGPGVVPELALHAGVVRVRAARRLRIQATHVGVDVGAKGDVEVEFAKLGDGSMLKSWLVPGGIGAAVGAAIVVLVHSGDVRVGTPESRPAPVAVEKPLVVQVPVTRPADDDDRDRKLAQAERRIADLEKKLAAAKKEVDSLASDLVKKKGVTIESITARFADLKKGGGMAVFLPGKTADLIADLKGLGPAGTQALLDLLRSEDAKDRFMAAKLLEDLKDPAAIPALVDVALNDGDEMAARMAGHALALMEDPRAIQPLRDILEKKRSWESEVNALWGLVNLGDQRALEQAVAYMNDTKVTGQARAALGANVAVFMHNPEVMPIVDATVRDFHEAAHVMSIAIEYYKAIGSPVARDRLQAMADDTRLSAAIREEARQALLQ